MIKNYVVKEALTNQCNAYLWVDHNGLGHVGKNATAPRSRTDLEWQK